MNRSSCKAWNTLPCHRNHLIRSSSRTTSSRSVRPSELVVAGNPLAVCVEVVSRMVMWNQLRLSRFKLAGPPTPRDTEASNAYAVIHDSLGPICICSLIGINSNVLYILLGFYQFTQPLVPLSRLYGEPWDFFGSFAARSL